MSRMRCVDYKIVDPEHVLIMYVYQLVLVNLKMSEDHDQLWGSGPVIPITVIKFEVEQDGLYLAPNFDFHRFPMILAREPPARDQNQVDQRAFEMDPQANKGSLF